MMERDRFYEIYETAGNVMGFLLNSRLYEYCAAPLFPPYGIVENDGRVLKDGDIVARIEDDKITLTKSGAVLRLVECTEQEIDARFRERGIERSAAGMRTARLG